MSDEIDAAIARVANARRMATTARAVSKAADEARVTAARNLELANAELHEKLDERIEAHSDAG
jgi:hypothetical protein